MPTATKYAATVWEEQDLAVMARLKSADNQDITQASLSSITMEVFDAQDSYAQVGSTTSLTIADVVYDTLQTGNGWSKDANGYNFRYLIDGSFFPDGGHEYRVEIVFIFTSGSTFPIVIDVSAKNRRGT